MFKTIFSGMKSMFWLCCLVNMISPLNAQNLLYEDSFEDISGINEVRMFAFGHSLISHIENVVPVPSNETSVPHWMYLLSIEAGLSYAGGGQFGFLPNQLTLPPDHSMNFDIVPSVWDSDVQAFSEADYNTILITPENFIQNQAGPNEPHILDNTITVVSATETIFDWVQQQEPGIRFYINENWPDMYAYLSSGEMPPSSSDYANYNAYTQNAFHQWWIDYHDAMMASRPQMNIRMIPVGPILGDLIINVLNERIPYDELYEDDAPHGRASLYFLAALITYMAVYETPAPNEYLVPDIIHSEIRNQYPAIVQHI